MRPDHSAGWDAISDRFMAIRSDVGATLVRTWAREHLPDAAAILDIGCGSGVPVARSLANQGFSVWGVDASPALIAAYRRNLPEMPAICEPAQHSTFFERKFVGVISIGLIFLLDEDDQRKLLDKVADVLEPNGRFLFSAPREKCRWKDTLTNRTSLSLGSDAYAAHLESVGLRIEAHYFDEGGNNHYDAVRYG